MGKLSMFCLKTNKERRHLAGNERDKREHFYCKKFVRIEAMLNAGKMPAFLI